MTLNKIFYLTCLLIISTTSYAAISFQGWAVQSNNNHNYLYEDYHFTSGFTSPVSLSDATDSYSAAVFNTVGARINTAFGISFSTSSGNWWDAPFINRVAILEMDAGVNIWMGVATAYIIDAQGNATTCNDTAWTSINTTTGDLIGLTTTGTMNTNCNQKSVNAGLIIMNTNEYDSLYGTGNTPGDSHKEHLLLHEFGHLSGIGHVIPSGSDRRCASVMVSSLFEWNGDNSHNTTLYCATVPTNYNADDKEVMEFKDF